MAYSTPAVHAKSLPSLTKYLLGRAALDLRTFTVDELARLTQMPVNTVYGFISHLGLGVTKEALPSDHHPGASGRRRRSPGRPQTLYSLNPKGVDQLLDENLEVARLLRAEGLDMPPSQQAPPSGAKVEKKKAQAGQISDTLPETLEEHVRRGGLQGAMSRPRGYTASQEGNVLPETLDEIYDRILAELSDLHKAELHVIKVLPRVTELASNETLRATFKQQVSRTKQQNARLKQVFKELTPPAGRLGNEPAAALPAIADVLQEAETRVREETEPKTRDRYLLAAVQMLEHYRVAGYGNVRFFAEILGENKAVELLQTTLNEERKAAYPLFHLAGVIRSS